MAGTRSGADLTGPRAGVPGVRFVRTARTAIVTSDPGRRIAVLTFDDTSPGTDPAVDGVLLRHLSRPVPHERHFRSIGLNESAVRRVRGGARVSARR
ncbi:hypothetical protein [Pseudonocardia sp. H11422]|uniref:hypothetical protein n=1 Tax=Pseudonocardia sp. H11422 TaxID=2835866 RepID=UPI001BDC3E75|nr:hypothetical protein [Pseudonocardia sp. H11422]